MDGASAPRLSSLERRWCLALSFFFTTIVPFSPAVAEAANPNIDLDVTFIFTNDIHACGVTGTNKCDIRTRFTACAREGKTEANFRRHIAGIRNITQYAWPSAIAGNATRFGGASQKIGSPQGIVFGGDLSNCGGGYARYGREGDELAQFRKLYEKELLGNAELPFYAGLGNHDLGPDGSVPHEDWYRRQMWSYVESVHHSSATAAPRVSVTNFDPETRNYSWDWDGLHLAQTHRFAGDASNGQISSLPWLIRDLAKHASDGRPVVIFQHYGWDSFSTGPQHWWSANQRRALLNTLKGYNVIALFHGHEHDSTLVYKAEHIDVFKPRAAFAGDFAVVRVTGEYMDVLFAHSKNGAGELEFLKSFTKKFDPVTTPD